MHNFPIDQIIPAGSPLFNEIHRIADENAPKIAELSGTFRTQHAIRTVLADITQSKIDEITNSKKRL